ncbi:MAG: hypothetical protein KDA87_21590, partial [Planctomycetales bacterium]|nr:hypothetical protein [Planctomycetales bacterium]
MKLRTRITFAAVLCGSMSSMNSAFATYCCEITAVDFPCEVLAAECGSVEVIDSCGCGIAEAPAVVATHTVAATGIGMGHAPQKMMISNMGFGGSLAASGFRPASRTMMGGPGGGFAGGLGGGGGGGFRPTSTVIDPTTTTTTTGTEVTTTGQT